MKIEPIDTSMIHIEFWGKLIEGFRKDLIESVSRYKEGRRFYLSIKLSNAMFPSKYNFGKDEKERDSKYNELKSKLINQDEQTD